MLTTPPSRWAVQGLTFLVWALAAACAVYWGLRLAARSSAGLPVAAAERGAPAADAAAIARLLGASQMRAALPVPSLASRFSLVGIVARPSHSGAALIAVDGKPPRPYRVGTAVDEGMLLIGVEPRRALLGPSMQAPAAIVLELPLPRR